jgi:hypothetical protein
MTRPATRTTARACSWWASRPRGELYAYALDHGASTFKRVASFASGHSGIMGLEFDPDSGALWAACDNTCAGVQNVLGIAGGKFVVRPQLRPPQHPARLEPRGHRHRQRVLERLEEVLLGR